MRAILLMMFIFSNSVQDAGEKLVPQPVTTGGSLPIHACLESAYRMMGTRQLDGFSAWAKEVDRDPCSAEEMLAEVAMFNAKFNRQARIHYEELAKGTITTTLDSHLRHGRYVAVADRQGPLGDCYTFVLVLSMDRQGVVIFDPIWNSKGENDELIWLDWSIQIIPREKIEDRFGGAIIWVEGR